MSKEKTLDHPKCVRRGGFRLDSRMEIVNTLLQVPFACDDPVGESGTDVGDPFDTSIDTSSEDMVASILRIQDDLWELDISDEMKL